MILAAPTAEHRPRWLEGRPEDRLSMLAGAGTALAQFAEEPETVWLFSGRLPKSVEEAKRMVRDHEGTEAEGAE